MAIPKSTAPIVNNVSAFAQLALDPGSIAANTNLDVDVNAPRNFKAGRPVLVQLKDGETELTTGLSLDGARCLYVSGTKKLRVRFSNNSAGAIDEASKTYQFFQL